MSEMVPVNQNEAPAMIYDDNLVAMAENAEKRIQAVNRIKQAALQVTNKHDWTDQGGKPYLQVSGAEKVARLFGISWRIDEPFLEIDEDRHFNYTYKGYFSMGNIEIEAIGARTSRDGFFNKRWKDGVQIELPPSEIDRNDVKKSAYTNCIGNGITRLLGLRNMKWEDLAAAGIHKEDVAGIDYKKPEMSDDAKDQKAEIRKMILEMVGNDPEQAKDLLEVLTRFTGRDGKEVPGKKLIDKLSEKQIPPTYQRVKKEYEKWQKANQGGSENESA